MAASCKQDNEYSVSIKDGNGQIGRGDFKFSRKILLQGLDWLVCLLVT